MVMRGELAGPRDLKYFFFLILLADILLGTETC
jgi:hypothetical protein